LRIRDAQKDRHDFIDSYLRIGAGSFNLRPPLTIESTDG
jgi:hypothetical protein